ncbi:flagellar biosynthetic protein FliQ [Desulfofarcimen acetoxidans DSM 771]|jgi:flagellar biosynthetic protein FliQ|uniref:Flagellar biosynthetic protein FliQ n=2 Tax=Desulfofarcimen acetoxidans TaxID=58138 RepID=C8W1H0_DESAS|nr:flagellar biosynthesis protein FliQ [Desulfofarcimen acetoxidans]ACV61615.1 flagellar biosynthetic protein FliQ [Desulfofarcimen acetoxidans DSM 771]
MTQTFAIHMAREAFIMMLILALPPIGAGLLVGLVVSVFQAVTQIQEQTLSFVPKLLAVFVVLLLFSSWMLNMMIDFTSDIFKQLPNITK